MAALPIDVLREVLGIVLGEERQDAYALMRPLSSFMLVCKTWREAAFTTPLRMNVDYMSDLPTQGVRWLQRMTFADLQLNPGMPINRVLTHPDFAARNQPVLTRLWGAALAMATPGRWPQFRHFPRLETLELSCDHYAASSGGGAGGQLSGDGVPDMQHFESRVLAPLARLKHLSLQQFGSADLSRLPPSLEMLHLDVFTATPLALPAGLRLRELSVACSRMLVDWGRLCSQVEDTLTIDTPSLEVLSVEGGGDVFKHVADGLISGSVAEVELVGQEVALVSLPPELQQARYARRLPNDYEAEVLEATHVITLADHFQSHHFRSFGTVYNPDDTQVDEDLGMTDGVTVRLVRRKPGEPQVLGFCYNVNDEQMSYLLSEATLEGLAMEAMQADTVESILNSEEFQRRNGPTLAWLQGLDLTSALQLAAFPQLRRLECYVLHKEDSLAAISLLPPSLTYLDICGACEEEADPLERDSWPDLLAGPDPRGGWETGVSLAHLKDLKQLSLRYFRSVNLQQLLPPGVDSLVLECLRPDTKSWERWNAAGPSCWPDLRQFDRFDFSLPPLALPPAGAEGEGERPIRSLAIQLHRSDDFPFECPTLYLDQFLQAATDLAVTVTADPPPEPAGEDGEEGEDEDEAAEKHRTRLLLVARHGSLKEALDDITDSPLQSIELEADEVMFTDGEFQLFTGSEQVVPFIKAHYGQHWLIWAHEPAGADEEDEEEEEGGRSGGRIGGGFTMTRRR